MDFKIPTVPNEISNGILDLLLAITVNILKDLITQRSQ